MILLVALLMFVPPYESLDWQQIRIEPNHIEVELDNRWSNSSDTRNATIDITPFAHIQQTNCSTGNNVCLQWADVAQLTISTINEHCDTYEYHTSLPAAPLTVTFNLTALALYGGPEMDLQSWPVQQTRLQFDAYVSSQKNSQAALESYWLDSSGRYLYVDEATPLFVNQTEAMLQLTASRAAPYIRPGNLTRLALRLCSFEHARAAHEDAIANVLHTPSRVPDFRMIRYPVWSTWAQFKFDVNETVVLRFADQISAHGFPNSQLEIDDRWETCYGSLTESTTKFPNMTELVGRLHSQGFRVTIWVHPFVNTDCQPYYATGVAKGYFVKNTQGSVVTQWWDGQASYIDFTNPQAVEWWQSRLRMLAARTRIDSFKFDAGESSWCPQVPVLHLMRDDHPDTILKAYMNATAVFGDMAEVRVARGTQQVGQLVRMMDRNSKWTGALGLDTLIPELLHLNIIGYPFVLPDMIGGNGYNNDVVSEELFVRWTQVNVFMPVMQFSYPPWRFSSEAQAIVKKCVELHSAYATKILELMEQATKTGTPVNRPLWWVDPTDPITFTIDSEYLLGDDILVAPILEENITLRDIYLPTGTWKDENAVIVDNIKGPVWLRQYPADLKILPYFTRIPSAAAPVSLCVAILVVTMLFTFII